MARELSSLQKDTLVEMTQGPYKTITSLAERLGVFPASLSRSMRRLYKDGYVEKSALNSNKYSLTVKGRHIVKEIQMSPIDRVVHELDAIQIVHDEYDDEEWQHIQALTLLPAYAKLVAMFHALHVRIIHDRDGKPQIVALDGKVVQGITVDKDGDPVIVYQDTISM